MDKRAKTKFEKMLTDNEWVFNDGSILDSDSDPVKIKIISKMYGIPEGAMMTIIKEYDDEMTPKPKSDNNYDITPLMDEVDRIMVSNQFELNIQKMNYVRYLKIKDSRGNPLDVEIPYDQVITAIESSIIAAKINNGGKYYYTAKDLLIIMKESANRIVRNKMDHILNSISYKSNDGFQKEWLIRLHKEYQIEQDFDIFETMMKHFCWQIKRKMLDLTTQNDVLLSFHGHQGIGKSWLFNNIFSSVLSDFHTPGATLQSVCDVNQSLALNSQFCMNIEEMSTGGSESQNRLSDKDIAVLKKNLTASHTTMRVFFTQNMVNLKIRASFISTTNKHLYSIINDETGMRRFFEFTSRRQTRMNYTEVDWIIDHSVDFFSTLDVHNDMGYWNMNNAVGKKISEIQKGYISSSCVKFLNQFRFYTSNDDTEDINDYTRILVTDFYDKYKEYCINSGVEEKYMTSKKNFAPKIEDMFGKDVFKSHARYDYVYVIGIGDDVEKSPKPKIVRTEGKKTVSTDWAKNDN